MIKKIKRYFKAASNEVDSKTITFKSSEEISKKVEKICHKFVAILNRP